MSDSEEIATAAFIDGKPLSFHLLRDTIYVADNVADERAVEVHDPITEGTYTYGASRFGGLQKGYVTREGVRRFATWMGATEVRFPALGEWKWPR